MNPKVGVDGLIAAGAGREEVEGLPREEYMGIFDAPTPPLAFAQDFRDGQLSLGWTRRETRTDGKRRTRRIKWLYLVTSDGDLYQGEAGVPGLVILALLRQRSMTASKTLMIIDYSTSLDGDAAWARRYLEGEREKTRPLLTALMTLLQRPSLLPGGTPHRHGRPGGV